MSREDLFVPFHPARTFQAFLLCSLVGILRIGSAQESHVVLIAGGGEYDSERTCSQVAQTLEEEFGFRTTLILPGGDSEDEDEADGSSLNFKAIEKADLLILFVQMQDPPEKLLELLREYFESGLPAIGIRTTVHAFANDRGWGPRYFGGHFWSRRGEELETYVIPEMETHPVLRGVPRHTHHENNALYLTNPLSDSATPLVLARASDDLPPQSYAWVNEYKEGSRQFFFTASHPEDFEEPDNRALLYNAVFWALGKDVPAGGVWNSGRAAEPKPLPNEYPPPPARKAPDNAEVLFNGKDLKQWDLWFAAKEPRVIRLDRRAQTGGGLEEYDGARWPVSDGAAVATPGYGDIVTRKSFTDYSLHLDFLVPHSPYDVDRIWRGNSGVYLNGRYEIQILDSAGESADDLSCGAFTEQHAPSKSAAKKAGEWQSLDVIFRAARYRGRRKTSTARATVFLNGEQIQSNVALSRNTSWGFRERSRRGRRQSEDDDSEMAVAGPIRLQADSSPVRFANVWVEPISYAKARAELPVIPGQSGQRWVDMDYGPYLSASIEVSDGNIACKGIAIRLDAGDGGVAWGKEFALFDTDTLRYAAAWTGSGCIDWRSVVYNGQHEVHPSLVGDLTLENPRAPGWGRPGDHSHGFEDPRTRGRDGLAYGPLPREWAHWKGLYLHEDQVVLSYTVSDTKVLEWPAMEGKSDARVFTRTLNLGPRSGDLVLQVAYQKGSAVEVRDVPYQGASEPLALLAPPGKEALRQGILAVAKIGGSKRVQWVPADDGQLRLRIAAGKDPMKLKLLHWRLSGHSSVDSSLSRLDSVRPPIDLSPMTRGGPRRWAKEVKTKPTRLSEGDGAFLVEAITAPMENPYRSWMRLGGFDFFADGRRAAVCTWMGDVWIVDGLGGELGTFTWRRFATGLYQTLGLKIVDGQIYVVGRDQITRLHDLNGDGEADFYENFNNDAQATEHFHEFTTGLQVDEAGNFYYMKGARHGADSVVPQHGTLLEVSKDGSKTEIIANGFRAPNGLCVNPDGSFINSDQEGHWTPANRINWVRPGGFYGYMWSYHRGEKPTSFDKPLCWVSPRLDISPAEQFWVTSDDWGALKGKLISLSYGTGNVYIVLHEEVNGQMQGAIAKMPVAMFPTGVMRGRFNKQDGQLYVCGLFGWSGRRTFPGGFFRISYTGEPVYLPLDFHATKEGVYIAFSDPIDKRRGGNVRSYKVERWNYRWAARYGSEDFRVSDGKIGRDTVTVESATVSDDGTKVFLKIPDMTTCMQMRISYRLRAADGERLSQDIYNTVNALGDAEPYLKEFK